MQRGQNGLGQLKDEIFQEKIQFNQAKLKKIHFFKIIILDASTSRESVFEHQRELALSLIERLPINRQDTHVAIGINSFTNVPVLRQTLGLGRERKVENGKIGKIQKIEKIGKIKIT